MPTDFVPASPAGPLALRSPSERTGPSAISQLLYVIFKWRRLILACGLAFTLAAVLVALLKPTVRTATAKMLFKQDRAALQISGLSPQAARLPYSPQALQSEVELFRSRSVLLPVAKTLLASQKVSSAQLDAFTEALRANLVVSTIPDTNLLLVMYYGPSAREAEDTLRLIVKQYTAEHAAAFRDSPAVLAFYETETKRAADELHRAEEALTMWQRGHGTVAIDSEISAQLDRIAILEKNLAQTEADIKGTHARLAALEQLAKAQPSNYVQSRERVANPLIAKLQADLAGAEVALNDATNTPLVNKLKMDLVGAEVALEDLRRRYTDTERVVVEKKEQIEMIRRELASAERDSIGVAQARLKQVKVELAAAQKQADVPGRESVGPNPLREGLERDLAGARAQVTSLASLRDTLRQQIQTATAEVGPLRDKKLGVDRLLRNIAVARESFLTHSKRLEEARIAAGLDKQSLTDLAVVEEPYATDVSDWPKRILLVVLAAVVGVGLGVAAAFGVELFNNSVRTPEDVEFHLGLPVVATIPALPGGNAPLGDIPRAALPPGARADRP